MDCLTESPNETESHCASKMCVQGAFAGMQTVHRMMKPVSGLQKTIELVP
jgi:hypothetical protein